MRRADIVGFGDAGVWAALATARARSPRRPSILADLGLQHRLARREASALRRGPDRRRQGRSDRIRRRRRLDVSVTGRRRPKNVLSGFCYDQGWRVYHSTRAISPTSTTTAGADIVGFGDAGVWTAINNGDGAFQPAAFVLADFGAHAGPVVQSITIDFHTTDDDLNDDTLLHVFVKNRANDSSDSEGARLLRRQPPELQGLRRRLVQQEPVSRLRHQRERWKNLPQQLDQSRQLSSCARSRFRWRSYSCPR